MFLIIYSAVYLFVVRVIFIAVVLFINNNIGEQRMIPVIGVVTEKVDNTPGGRTSDIYRLKVKTQSGKVLNFTTKKDIVYRYNIGSKFELEMEEGSIGFVYLDR